MTTQHHPEHFTVWTEIPATDLDRAVAFYEAVLQTEMEHQQMGPDVTAVFKTSNHPMGVAGHVYRGKPAGDGSGPTVHLSIAGALEDAMARVEAAGGTKVSDPIPLPGGYGRFAYAMDLDGNSIGLFETAQG